MGGVKDLVIDNLDFDYEDTDTKEMKELFKMTCEQIKAMNNELVKIKDLLAQSKQVNKNVGRKKCKLYYDNVEITDEQLKNLKKEMSTAEILKDFRYVNEYNQLINPNASAEQKQLCRNMIANRTR